MVVLGWECFLMSEVPLYSLKTLHSRDFAKVIRWNFPARFHSGQICPMNRGRQLENSLRGIPVLPPVESTQPCSRRSLFLLRIRKNGPIWADNLLVARCVDSTSGDRAGEISLLTTYWSECTDHRDDCSRTALCHGKITESVSRISAIESSPHQTSVPLVISPIKRCI